MNKNEAADIINAISNSLRNYTNQFSIDINITGFSAQNSGGTGYAANVQGGGPGSITTGFSANMSNTNISIQQGIAKQQFSSEINSFCDGLDKIVSDLRTSSPNKNSNINFFKSLTSKLIPHSVIAAITYVLNHWS